MTSATSFPSPGLRRTATTLEACCPSTWRFRVRQPGAVCPSTWSLTCPSSGVGAILVGWPSHPAIAARPRTSVVGSPPATGGLPIHQPDLGAVRSYYCLSNYCVCAAKKTSGSLRPWGQKKAGLRPGFVSRSWPCATSSQCWSARSAGLADSPPIAWCWLRSACPAQAALAIAPAQTRDPAPMASGIGPAQVGRLSATTPPAPAGGPERAARPHSQVGEGERRLGLPEDRGRAAQAGPPLFQPHRPQGAPLPWPGASTAAKPAHLARVRAPARRPDPGHGLHHRTRSG